LRFARVVYELPSCRRRFSLLAVELDVVRHGSESFPETPKSVEIRPPDPLLVPSKYRRRAKPMMQFQ
jgi:hypothetical protein